MFVWRKRASTAWLAANAAALREVAGRQLVIISKVARKNAIAEVAGKNRRDLERIRSQFGGRIGKLPRDWTARYMHAGTAKPIKIGKRLVIYRSSANKNWSRKKILLIPAAAAFGTGEHVTTAMMLRLLEETTRDWGAQAASLPISVASRNSLRDYFSSASCRRVQAGSLRSPNEEWSLLDLGTGSGILALAAARFGAQRVIAIDNDPAAIAVAKENARRNRIENVDFQVADVRRWRFPRQIDIVTANLFSELLIEILPKLKSTRWLILSGVLRKQEAELRRVLKQNLIGVMETRRRGKWTAVLAHGNQGAALS